MASLDLSGFVHAAKDGRDEIDFAVQGVTCAACIGKIERAVKALPGAPDARLNFATRRLKVQWNSGAFDPAAVAAKLEPLGYYARPFDQGALDSDDAAEAKRLLRCLAVAGFAAMNVMLLSVSVWAGAASAIDPATRDLFHWISALIALPAAAFAGQPFFSSAFKALMARTTNMDVPISVGVVLALALSLVETIRGAEQVYFDGALMLMFFLLVGRALDQAMRRKTRAVAANMASLRAQQATLMKIDGTMVETPIAAIAPGDRVYVRPGERVPVDGRVGVGASAVDDSLITGETKGRSVAAGDGVYAGSINLSGALEVDVVAASAGTLLDEVERLLENALSTKSRYVRLADRVAAYYAPVVHLTALLTGIGWAIAGASLHDVFVIAISVLIVTCPCAIALAIPAVQVVVAGALLRSGVLLNRGDAIERLAEVDTVVFDKTGTLTLPELAFDGLGDIPPDLAKIAVRLAASSHHPLARALAKTGAPTPPFANAVEEPARGVRAMVKGEEARLGSLEFCGLDTPNDSGVDGLSRLAFRLGSRTAIFRLSQVLRADAPASVDWLRRRGYRVAILSGDNEAAVGEIARALGVEDAVGGLKPAQKVARLAALAQQGRKTLMVGDGLNDAPALAGAHVSMSPSSAADLAQNVADAVFMGDLLAPVCAALQASKRAVDAMRQNLVMAALYNAAAVPLAIFGHLTPIVAALAMSSSSLVVTVNALRLRNAAALDLASNGNVAATKRSAPLSSMKVAA